MAFSTASSQTQKILFRLTHTHDAQRSGTVSRPVSQASCSTSRNPASLCSQKSNFLRNSLSIDASHHRLASIRASPDVEAAMGTEKASRRPSKPETGKNTPDKRLGPKLQPNPFDAVIEVGGSQQLVAKDRYYSCNNLKVEPGTEIAFERVLAVKEGDKLHIGQPYVKGAKVHAKVVENYKDKKIIVYKMKPKKHTRKTQGYRSQRTQFVVTDVTME